MSISHAFSGGMPTASTASTEQGFASEGKSISSIPEIQDFLIRRHDLAEFLISGRTPLIEKINDLIQEIDTLESNSLPEFSEVSRRVQCLCDNLDTLNFGMISMHPDEYEDATRPVFLNNNDRDRPIFNGLYNKVNSTDPGYNELSELSEHIDNLQKKLGDYLNTVFARKCAQSGAHNSCAEKALTSIRRTHGDDRTKLEEALPSLKYLSRSLALSGAIIQDKYADGEPNQEPAPIIA